jgi:DNA-binding transcriptional MerR regulator
MLIKIGDFAKEGGVSVKALRHYEKLGLLQPAWVNRFNG